jgi:hypothetical protein
MALVTVCSAKGAPGVTSTALALAAAWPKPVLLLEADPTGGDLAWRCRAGGKQLTGRPGLLDLAGDVRGTFDPDAVLAKSCQQLACGVSVVQGVTSPAQAAGIGGLWSQIAQAARAARVDVIADVGRLQSAPRVFVMEATQLVVVGIATMEQLVHLRETIRELGAHLKVNMPVTPVLVGDPRHAKADCEDLNRVLVAGGVHAAPARHLSWDSRSLLRLRAGLSVEGKKAAKAPLITSAKQLAEHLAEQSAGQLVEPRVSPWILAGRRGARGSAARTGGNHDRG